MSKYMKKLVFSLLVFGISILGVGRLTLAGPIDPTTFNSLTIEDYGVTVKKIEVAKALSGPWLTLGEGTKYFDLADYGIDQAAGSYITDTSLDAGTYNYVRITISKEIEIKGYGDDGTTTYYTTTSSNPQYGNIAGTESYDSNFPSPSSGDYASGTFTIPGDAEDTQMDMNGTLEFVNNDNDVRLGQDLSLTSSPIEISPDGTTNIKAFFAVNDDKQPPSTWQSDAASLKFEEYGGNYYFFIGTPSVVVFTGDSPPSPE